MRWLLTLIMVALCGCATVWQEKRESFLERSYAEYEAAQPCCDHYKDFEYERFDGEGVTFDIGGNGPFYAFPDGRSFFAAFSLPSAAAGERIRVKSLLVPGGITHPIQASAMLLPVATFLAEDFSVVAVKEAIPEREHAGWLSDTQAGGVAFMRIPVEASYMVVHTIPERFDQAFRFSRTDPGSIVAGVYVSAGTFLFAVPFAPTGRVFIRYAESDE